MPPKVKTIPKMKTIPEIKTSPKTRCIPMTNKYNTVTCGSMRNDIFAGLELNHANNLVPD